MLSRLLLLALIAFILWRIWRSVTGVPPGPRRPAAGRGDSNAAPRQIEDMTRCATCNTFVTASARSCGRTDCPRR
jgi:hypothetical protein